MKKTMGKKKEEGSVTYSSKYAEIWKELDEFFASKREMDSAEMCYATIAFACGVAYQCAPSVASADELIQRALEVSKKTAEEEWGKK